MNDYTKQAMPHQLDAVNFLRSKGSGILVHDMGLGKSLSAIAYGLELQANLWPNEIRVLVICPAIARHNWKHEFNLWGDGYFDPVRVIEKTNEEVRNNYGATIISYNMAVSDLMYQNLKTVSWDLIIIDEAHYLKSEKAKRSKYIYGTYFREGGLVAKASNVVLLTGTLAPNHVGEVWTHLSRLFPETISGPNGRPMSKFQFMQRYCLMYQNSFGWQVKGNNSSTIKELTRKLRPIIHRRKKDIIDLPPLRVYPYYIPVPKKLSKELEDFLRSEEGKVLVEVLHDASAKQSGKTFLGALSTLRRLTSIAKAETAVDITLSSLEDGVGQLVLFAHHRACIELVEWGLKAKGVRVDKLYGGTPEKTRQNIIKSFQEGYLDVVVCQLQAASTAINLHSASNVLLIESDWVPGNNLQAINRCHRIGQKKMVTARIITLEGSIDEVVQETIARKTQALQEAGL